MPSPVHYATLIDQFLAADKRLLGTVTTSDWKETQTAGEWKVEWPILVGDESQPEHKLCLTAYPNFRPVKWHITLIVQKAIFRVDFVDDGEYHTNSFDRPADLKEHIIWGPHYHAWPDNRRFCTARSLPDWLHNARPLPGKHHNFHNALRWFCTEARIAFPANDLIDLPKPDRFL